MASCITDNQLRWGDVRGDKEGEEDTEGLVACMPSSLVALGNDLLRVRPVPLPLRRLGLGLTEELEEVEEEEVEEEEEGVVGDEKIEDREVAEGCALLGSCIMSVSILLSGDGDGSSESGTEDGGGVTATVTNDVDTRLSVLATIEDQFGFAGRYWGVYGLGGSVTEFLDSSLNFFNLS